MQLLASVLLAASLSYALIDNDLERGDVGVGAAVLRYSDNALDDRFCALVRLASNSCPARETSSAC